ncbi:hypothetical protein V6N11_012576 [Hibiscus sabdariffa]|uniref:Uncharacterized protein n=1 Tax=Hibiscus sabdariffa TaxID=183260 RepID=A0ABR2QBT6_9ROSI
MVDDAGGWDWSRLTPWLSKDTLEKITAIMPPRLRLGVDSLGWRWEDNRNFTTRSAYTALNEENVGNEHVLRLCPQVRQLWSATIAPDKFSLFDSLDFDTWILQCFKHVAGIGVGDDVWPTRFSVICWLVWKKRCATVFGGASLHGVVLARYGNTIAAEFADAHASRATTKRLHPAPWCPPARGWVKINCDGAVAHFASCSAGFNGVGPSGTNLMCHQLLGRVSVGPRVSFAGPAWFQLNRSLRFGSPRFREAKATLACKPNPDHRRSRRSDDHSGELRSPMRSSQPLPSFLEKDPDQRGH